ncbi:amino acid permease (plasmid) [Prescottella equi]|uniref:amino acid permease n=1 Tax=Rhodococcus hoagii TaxID=43767 RepID=UPI00257780CE|nr:amino acid permease [Prescottella equi]WJJ14278.1 amino acid permease [Prescottella equi]
MTEKVDQTGLLKAGLTKRQMNMIAVGGVIGAGLFVGSGSAIAQAGPASIISYAAVGLLVVLVMRMLAELAVHSPETGSFASYARRELGPWAGLATGWCYAYLWAVVVGFEATAGAGILNRLIPVVPAWAAALIFMTILTASNLLSVRTFGTLEVWFASVKIAAIVAFLVIGAIAIAGLFPGVEPPGASNLLDNGGFAPNGYGQVVLAGLVVLFSYFGTEVVTIAAGEAEDPHESVRHALRTVVVRVLVFYIGSVAVIVTLLPSSHKDITKSPFVATLDHLGIPYAGTAMDLVVMIAVLSCLNSGIYTCSRTLFAMAERGEAPSALTKTSSRGVPAVAILAASAGGFATVIANYFLPTAALFDFLLESTGCMALTIYIIIAATQLRGRRNADRTGVDLPLRMWGYPYVTWMVIAVLVVVGIGLAINGPTRHSLILSLVVSIVAIVGGLIYQKRTNKPDPSVTPSWTAPRSPQQESVRGSDYL